MEKIQEVKEGADLIELFRSYGLRLERRGNDFFTSCPFHEDKTPSLSVNPEKKVFHCFSCGEKGNAIQFVQKMEGLGFREAVAKLSNGNGAPIQNGYVNKTSDLNRIELLASIFKRFQFHYKKSNTAQAYLIEKRGLNFAKEIEAGYCPANFATRLDKELAASLIDVDVLHPDGCPRFSECVVLPLRDVAGRITGLYGRKIKGEGTGAAGRHYYLPGEREGVFSIHDGESDEVYITESVIDALSLNHMGITSVLALHGVNGFTPVHEKWLSAKLPVADKIKTVYLLLDGDRPGREASIKLKALLEKKGYAVHNIELPEGQDPNSFLIAGKGIKELKAQPGNPKNEGGDFSRKEGEYIYKSNGRSYTIRGLTADSFSKLRVTVRCDLPGGSATGGLFYIDQPDLYAARSRGAFIEGLCKELGQEVEAVAKDIRNIITHLEGERARLKVAVEEKEKPRELTTAEREEAIKTLKDKRLFKNLLSDYERLGVVGDEGAKLLCTIGTVSRLLPKPFGVLIVSRSGAGKTTLQDAVSDFVPPESLIKLTRLTGQALFYKDAEGLRHKVLAIEEEEGMEQALYSIRTLQSSQRLTTATTRTDPKTGRLLTDEFTVKGPVFIMLSSTNPNTLDAETRSRFVITTIDESKEQTLRIFKWGDRLFSGEGESYEEEKEAIKQKWQNVQRLLLPLKVRDDIMPLMDYPAELLQHRRERQKYRSLLHAIALFRQYQKTVHKDARGDYIEVDVEDVALANRLTLEFFQNSLDDLAPHTRKLGEVISTLCEEKNERTFTRRLLREYSGWTDWSIRQGLEQLLELEYITKLSGQNGITFQYRLLMDLRSESRRNLSLTSVEVLEKRLKKAKATVNG